MTEAETQAGSWLLDEAVDRHWRLKGLDAAFRREWPDPTATEYEPLWDGMAGPEPPGPYAVFEKDEPQIVARMTGLHPGEDREIHRWTFRFHIHTRDLGVTTAKERARWLAQKVAAAFDPHNAIEIGVDGDMHILTERGPDWHVREGDKECDWTLEFSILVDAKVRISGYDAVFDENSSSSSISISSQSSMSSSSSSSSSSSITQALEEEDDVLDFGDIGGVYDSQAAAVANSAALRAYLATRVNESVNLSFRGPVNYDDSKRQPGDAYLDLSAGAIAVTVGGTGNISHLEFWGGSKIYGVNAASAATPIFQFTRGVGTMPRIVLRDLAMESDGSVIKVVYGGSGVVIDSVKIDDFTGAGAIDHEDWTDVDAGTCSYGLRIEDADGVRVQNLQIKQGGGHGVVSTRCHAGQIDARIQHCDGAGFKLAEANGTRCYLWAEHCKGYGVMARDTGMNRRSGGVKVADDGGTSDWMGWLEGNNGRGTSHTASGYRWSQFRLDDCARIRFSGHTGWSSNLARLDRVSRLRNQLIDDYWIDPSIDPSIEMVTDYFVNVNLVLPADGFGNLSITNWNVVWPNEDYRPIAEIVGTGVEGDPERIRVTYPAGCFDAAVGTSPAYWRPFNNIARSSPGSFYWTAQIKGVSGAAEYCLSREALGVANRQMATIGNFAIAPVAGALTPFALYDTHSRWLGGSFSVDDTRSDIQPEFNAWANGQQDTDGDASQDDEIIVDIYQLRLYQFV